MKETNHHDPPRLRFTKEELEDPELARPIAKAEKAADKYEAALKKLKKKRRLKLTREEVNTSEPEITDKDTVSETGETDPFHTEEKEIAGEQITDPRAPAVRNTRQKPSEKGKAAQWGNASGKAEAAKTAATSNAKAGPGPKASSAGKKKTVRLEFEETQAKHPSRLTHPIEKTVRTAGDQLHHQVAKANEDDNAAVDAVLRADNVKDSALRMGEHVYHAGKLRPYKQAEKAGKRLDKANIRALEARTQRERPHFTSNPYSRWQQKRAIRKEYASAKRRNVRKSAEKTAEKTEKAVEKTGKAAGRTAAKAGRHPAILAILALGGLLLILLNTLQSCAPLTQSFIGSLTAGTYPASEEDVRAAEQVYLRMEEELRDELEHYDQYHPEYNECYVDADPIWHDPYVLIAIISACFDGEEWTVDTAMPVIERFFDHQYVVSETVDSEIRFRMETLTGTRTVTDPYTGQTRIETYTYEQEMPYEHKICYVTMENKNLSHLPAEYMSHHGLSMFALYMSTHGNMEGIFTGDYAEPLKEPMLYDIPQETLDADPTFAKLMEEATKYIGFPYIWGGSDPETSFDCSGFICWVYTQTGICNTGRVGAKGLRSLCMDVPEEEAQPGDIVFFDGTMGEGVEGVTHCGIYVGNDMMLHCGSPIGYADLTESYWRNHFHSFGRVPN